MACWYLRYDLVAGAFERGYAMVAVKEDSQDLESGSSYTCTCEVYATFKSFLKSSGMSPGSTSHEVSCIPIDNLSRNQRFFFVGNAKFVP